MGFLRSGDAMQTFVLAPLDVVIFVLAVWMTVEAVLALRKAFAARRAAPGEPKAPAEAAAEGTEDK